MNIILTILLLLLLLPLLLLIIIIIILLLLLPLLLLLLLIIIIMISFPGVTLEAALVELLKEVGLGHPARTHIYIYIYMYNIYVYIHVYIYIYICIYTHRIYILIITILLLLIQIMIRLILYTRTGSSCARCWVGHRGIIINALISMFNASSSIIRGIVITIIIRCVIIISRGTTTALRGFCRSMSPRPSAAARLFCPPCTAAL